MHWQAFTFVQIVKTIIPEYFYNTKVIEFGSHTVNYSIRELFSNPECYMGVDLSPGKTVDVIAPAQDVYLGNKFDIAISCECFEHNPYYQETFLNMFKHLGEQGVVIFTCATTGRPEHGTSRTDLNDSPGTASVGWDYYKNLVQDDFDSNFIKQNFKHYLFVENEESQDLYFVGFKQEVAQVERKFELIKSYINKCKNIGKEYSLLWRKQGNKADVVDVLCSLELTHMSPYLLEHTLPLLLTSEEESVVSKLEEIVNTVYFNFSCNALALYQKALVEFNRENYVGVCAALDSGGIQFETYSNFKLYCDSLWGLGRKRTVLDLVTEKLELVINSPEWMRIQFISQLIDVDVLPFLDERLLDKIVAISDKNTTVIALYARYLFRTEREIDAIKHLEAVLVNSSEVPAWVTTDLNKYKSLVKKKYALIGHLSLE
ncbi:class I SAM-dependent methyltransferase [Pseudoalteromonas agarivorans]|uniref:class I SAM-dependent methyltransferase n=1 Tax=Pseudoalteromonas agarivorans TaxID=176102 RepID=UPI0021174E81|nr:class I SAM-dependent methyltransferase [Pseudoalteromonas agarivorans]MCQ8887699.1 class I SAM-dependent methyltransferase [Pseudoalteromonas agarivorans]